MEFDSSFLVSFKEESDKKKREKENEDNSVDEFHDVWSLSKATRQETRKEREREGIKGRYRMR